ncbi:MAG: hypothetical protein H6964_07840 [Chromatiaceae bacterium]|nr:hypothetical protein [Gammaproteobacteria bacterium]MCP5427094.1 hypothetical protein [Chromatiaceae bacterium]MCB1863297.1 hypothetical protein [Gammaproteobacteria bacterium]MCB1873734.1 hypothetical protein [Gammaproteobacteria bacterium]MCB1881660.1 hypothetical protein [Gammaproteobacteria bacterium]
MNTPPTRLFVLIAVLLPLTIGGCQSLASRQSNIELDKVLSSYQTTVRWGTPDQAYIFMKPENQSEAELPADLDNVRITGYEVVRQPVPVSEGVVSQTAKISYTLKDRQIERHLLDQQTWEYQPEQKIWYRISPIPEYK